MPNEDEQDTNGFIPEEVSVVEEAAALYGMSADSREKLDQYVEDYNALFGTNYSTKDSQSFHKYYQHISKMVKDRKIDILLVVNMFLTGFDSPPLNTLYVDKTLKYHGLLQAYSRTNRILNEQKSQGNIVVFRNLKKATDEAITLFSDKDAIETVVMKPYEEYVKKFNLAYIELLKITPTVKSVDSLMTEDQELAFIKAFRDLMRIKNTLNTFSDFKWQDLSMNEQTFEDFKAKYLDLWQKVKIDRSVEKVSILEDVDFELELIHRDEINVNYIVKLLMKIKASGAKDASKTEKEIQNLLKTEVTLRSKRALIEQFIAENLPYIGKTADVPEAFDHYWNLEQQNAFKKLTTEENLSEERTQKLIENYLYAERAPISDEVLDLIEGEAPSVLKRREIGNRIWKKIAAYVETYINGITGKLVA